MPNEYLFGNYNRTPKIKKISRNKIKAFLGPLK
jgi:hypothetical protein